MSRAAKRLLLIAQRTAAARLRASGKIGNGGRPLDVDGEWTEDPNRYSPFSATAPAPLCASLGAMLASAFPNLNPWQVAVRDLWELEHVE